MLLLVLFLSGISCSLTEMQPYERMTSAHDGVVLNYLAFVVLSVREGGCDDDDDGHNK